MKKPRGVIPSWHLKLLLAQNLGLDVKALLKDGTIKPSAPSGMRFKRSTNLGQEKPADPNLAYFSRIAKSIAGMTEASAQIPGDPKELHAEIMAMTGVECVTLKAILDYCWSRNIAVVHVDKFPLSKKGLDALVYQVKGRYIIIVARKVGPEASARASFIIAHELAHIALGHVAENQGLIDDLSESERGKHEEGAADSFAADVLRGGRYKSTWRRGARRADTLAELAEQCGKEWQIDPGHMLYRFARKRYVAQCRKCDERIEALPCGIDSRYDQRTR